jgi:flagellar hook-associated protein 2
MFGISSSSTSSLLNQSYLNALVTQAMAAQQRTYELAQTQRNQLNLTRSVYVDLNSKFSELASAVESLTSGIGSTFGAKSATSSDESVVKAVATSGAAAGQYELTVNTLAKAHRVGSEQQAYVDQALGLSGTFIIGGVESRAVSNAQTVANTVDGFAASAAILDGQKELGSGQYYVEIRDNNGTWQFRLVDADGSAMRIASVDDPDTLTSDWQDLAAVAGQTYDTGRGLQITFGSGSYTAGLRGSGAASVTYAAQGATIEVTTSATLADIASAINNATYADGNEVRATIVDRRLVLTAQNTGTRHTIVASDKTGTVLAGTGSAGLGILGSGGAGDVDLTDGFLYTLQQAANTSLIVNGVTATRQKSTGLTDIISGVTLNLYKEGSNATANLTIAPDTKRVTDQINTFLSRFNSLTAYLKAKTETTRNSDGTYTRGGLANEPTFYRLRYDLLSDLVRAVPRSGETALPAGDPTSLESIGITLGADLTLSISDSGKLSAALSANYAGVERLFNTLMNRLKTRLDPYTRTTDSLMDRYLRGIDNQIKSADASLRSLQARMTQQEEALRRQYAALFEQISMASANQPLVNIFSRYA